MSKKTVLLVEDDMDLVDKLKPFLEKKGYEVTVKCSVKGKKFGALDELLASDPDKYSVIIMDIRLPPDDDKYIENLELTAEWYELQMMMITSGGGENINTRLDELAIKMNKNINSGGGLKVIDDWLEDIKDKKGTIGWGKMPILIFFSSRSKKNLDDNEKEILEKYDERKCHFIQKPVPSKRLLEVMASPADE